MAGDMTRRQLVRWGAGALLTLAAGGGLSGCEAGDRYLKGEVTVVDDAGRELAIPAPERLGKVFFTSALAGVFCFTLAPDLVGGAAARIDAEDLAYLPERMAEVPVLGSLSGGGEIDREALMAEGIDLMFSVSAVELSSSNVDDAERLQRSTGIPVVLVDGSDLNLASAYRLLGRCLGAEARAEELAGYCEEIYSFVTGVAASVPEGSRRRFYYAEGPTGLQTEPQGSQHAIAFDAAGGENVCKLEVGVAVGYSDVSMEHVLSWDPDYIVALAASEGGADEYIRSDPAWAGVSAVREGRVYTMPHVPFNWVDRPTAVNRYLGMHWLCWLFYPDRYSERYDIVDEVVSFYSRFFWRDITREEAIGFLGSSYPG